MRTPKQIAASRANGAKSKGPVTAQGKRNSSRNSLRHGMFADTIVLEAEKRNEFLKLVSELWDEHQPQTPTEKMLVETIAAASWRQQRIWGMQKIALDYDVTHSPASASELDPLRAVLSLRASPESVRTHEHLLRCEIAADRQISRALHRLLQLQEKRESIQQTAPAERTQQPVEKTSPPPQPQPDPKPLSPVPATTTSGQPVPNSPRATQDSNGKCDPTKDRKPSKRFRA